MNTPPELPDTPPDSPAAPPRWVDRHQSLAAALVVMFSMFSPAVDVRPKPVLPAKYEIAEPSDPPDLGPNLSMEDTVAKSEAPGGTKANGPGSLPADPHPFLSAKAQKRYLAGYDARAQLWPVPSQTQMVTGRYGQTFVRISGPVDAPPLVLLHGISSNSLAWLPNVEALSAHYRVYAVDHIFDFGRSIYARPLRSADDHLAWLDELFNALSLAGPVRLVGLSYGGWLAARYGLHAPERVAGLALLAPVCTVLPLAPGWIARAILCALPHPWFARNFLRWLLPDLAALGGPAGSSFDDTLKEALAAMRAFKSRRLVPADVFSDAELAAIKVPALFMVGVNEKIYSPQKACERLGDVAPHIRTRLLPGCGHDLSVVQATRVNRELVSFFGALQSGSPP
jgi:pimeloyl-ACP methyl ester carboxylesterase